MLKRDSLTAQMQQLSQVLAKVKRLIIEDKEVEAIAVTQDIFEAYYKMSIDELISSGDLDFCEKVRKLQAEEVNMLAYFIDEYAGLQEELRLQLALYKRYLLLVELLEHEYQFMSIDHMARASILDNAIAKSNFD